MSPFRQAHKLYIRHRPPQRAPVGLVGRRAVEPLCGGVYVNALAKAFEFFAQYYSCVAVNFTGMKAGEMPRANFDWANSVDGTWRVWEILEAEDVALGDERARGLIARAMESM